MIWRKLILVVGGVLVISLAASAGEGFGFKCDNKECGYKANVVFGGGKLFERAMGWCHKCGKFESVQWTRPGARLLPDMKPTQRPEPLAEIWNPATGQVRKVYKCPDCGGGFMEVTKPEELSHCPKCNHAGFKIDPDEPRMMID